MELAQSKNLMPIEWVAGRRCYSGNSMYVDWTSNIINAHYIRITKVLDLETGTIHSLPLTARDNEEAPDA